MAGLYLNEDYQAVFGSNLGFITVEMPRKSAQEFPENPENDPQLHLDYVRRLLAPLAVDGRQVRIRAEPGGPPAGKAITVRVVGPDDAAVTGLAREVTAFLRSDPDVAPWLQDLGDDQGRPSRIYRFRVQPRRAAEFGLTPREVAALAGSVLDGRRIGEFRTQDEDIDLRLKIDPEALAVPEKALDLPLLAHPSGPVRLADLTRVETVMEPNKLSRYQGNRALTLSANLKTDAPTSSAAIVNRIGRFYQGIKARYPGAEIDFAGEFASTRRSYLSLTYAFFVAILIIYLILATQFHSYLQPVIILSSVVFALIGVGAGKLVSQGLFTVNSFIAVVGVTGVVVNDSLVLIDFINRRYRAGATRREAIFEGVRVRLRPILLTTLTTVLGLLPMSLGIPSYSVVWGSMASTFVTGLATATFLTLFIVPVQWDLLTALTERRAARKAKRKGPGTGEG
jgi:HAE1 family hydrophobic/amphiphilic exporter-1